MLNAKDYRDCLSARTFAHLRDSCQALAAGQHLASAVCGSVLLEAILEDFAEVAKLPAPGQADLNGRIQQLQERPARAAGAARGVARERAGGVRVFLSTINPHTPAQEDFLEALESRLRAIGVEPVRFVAPR